MKLGRALQLLAVLCVQLLLELLIRHADAYDLLWIDWLSVKAKTDALKSITIDLQLFLTGCRRSH